jgi:hypothetical protein
MEISGTKPIAEVPKSRNQKDEWKHSWTKPIEEVPSQGIRKVNGKTQEQNQSSSSSTLPKPTTQTSNQKKKKQTHTHNFPKTHKTPRKKKGGSQEAVSKLIQALRGFLTYFSNPKNHTYPEAAESTIIITHHHHKFSWVFTKHHKHKRIKSKSKCSSWELLNKSVGISSISS